MKRVTVAVLCTALLAGCGGGDDSDKPETDINAVVAELQQSSREGDGETICTVLFTENLAISVKRASGQTCAKEVADNVTSDDAAYKLEKLQVRGNNANAVLVDQQDRRSAVLFQRENGEWRIARIAGVGS